MLCVKITFGSVTIFFCSIGTIMLAHFCALDLAIPLEKHEKTRCLHIFIAMTFARFELIILLYGANTNPKKQNHVHNNKKPLLIYKWRNLFQLVMHYDFVLVIYINKIALKFTKK